MVIDCIRIFFNPILVATESNAVCQCLTDKVNASFPFELDNPNVRLQQLSDVSLFLVVFHPCVHVFHSFFGCHLVPSRMSIRIFIMNVVFRVCKLKSYVCREAHSSSPMNPSLQMCHEAQSCRLPLNKTRTSPPSSTVNPSCFSMSSTKKSKLSPLTI